MARRAGTRPCWTFCSRLSNRIFSSISPSCHAACAGIAASEGGVSSANFKRVVWIIQRATRPGGVKEKTLIKEFEDGGVRFQGEITLPNGGAYLDRTTLTPLEEGKVRQVIETSRDGGKTWGVGFDAVYVSAGRRK